MYRTPKTDWVASDYFNYTDYTRIVDNIKEVFDFSKSLYPNYSIIMMESASGYSFIPHANTWNNISNNIIGINEHTYNFSFPENVNYVDNGYSPNYEEFNRWESSILTLMTNLRVEAKTLPRLQISLGRPILGTR